MSKKAIKILKTKLTIEERQAIANDLINFGNNNLIDTFVDNISISTLLFLSLPKDERIKIKERLSLKELDTKIVIKELKN